MNSIKKAFYLIWKIYFLIVFLGAFLVLFIPFMILFSIGKRPFKMGMFLMRVHSWFISIMTLTVFIINGKENFPKAPYIICANHSSYTDIVYAYCIIPDYFVFLAKKELGSIPLFKVFFRSMNILVDRKNSAAAKQSLETCAERLKEGESIIIFPEGTIPESPPKLKSFKNGPFSLAIKTGVPILPITFLDNHKRLAEGSWFAKASPGQARVVIHEPIDTKNLSKEDLVSLKEQTYDAIAEPLKDIIDESK